MNSNERFASATAHWNSFHFSGHFFHLHKNEHIFDMPSLFIFMLCAYLIGNVYIYIRGLQALQHFSPLLKWIFSIFFWIGVFSLVLVFLLRHSKISVSWMHLFANIGTGWLVFTLYMVMILLFFDLFRIINHPVPHSYIISLLLTLCILAYGHYRYQHPDTQVINIDINKSLRTSASSLKVVAVSDVHLGYGTTKKQLRKYVKMINAQQPDIIIISGDLIDNDIVPVLQQHMEEELSELNAPMGIYMVPGNHEYISGITDCIAFLSQKTPVRLLRDSVVTLPNGVQIIGRDDKRNSSRKKLSELARQTDPAYPVIVLDHQPYELSASVNANVDLSFYGHTHDGQVWPLNYLTSRLFDVSYGYVKRAHTHLYVSSGLSLWGPPFRIGTNSEIVVFTLSLKE